MNSMMSIQSDKQTSPLFALIDGYSLLFRAYYSMGDMKAPDGMPTGALFGLASMLIKAIQDLKPDYMVVAFDYPGPTFRHKQFSEYKANRDHAPDELKLQMSLARELVKALGIDYEELEGYEADDIIGTLAVQAEKKGWQVKILTGDSDLGQIVNDNITVIQTISRATESRILNESFIKEKYGIASPINLRDYKALVGDSSDNIPGVRGIGEVTAKKLFAQFRDLEEIYNNLDKIDEKTRQKLIAGRDMAMLSRDLVTIRTDLPIMLDSRAAEKFKFDFSHIDKTSASMLLRRYGFKSLADKLGVSYGVSKPDEAQVESILVNDKDKLDNLLSELRQIGRFALDFETSDINPRTSELVGIAISTNRERAYYIPVGHQPSVLTNIAQLDLRSVIESFKPVLADGNIEKICQNGKFEWLVCDQFGIELRGLVDDPMIADYLINPDNRHGLKEIAQRELGWLMSPIENLIGSKGKDQISMKEVSIEKARDYACLDAAATWAVMEILSARLAQDGLDKLYREIEMPLVSILASMEATGIKVDVRVLEEIAADLDQRMSDMSSVIYQQIGRKVNLNSPKQLAELLFDEMKLPEIKGRSTDAEVLEKLARHHEVPAMIHEYRLLAKLRGTYTQSLIDSVGNDGRIHTSYNQTIAGTGRLSSSEPNLQNIPIRTETGQQIRKAFVANDGEVLISADYSQIELRLVAHFSGDARLIEAFANDEDIHKRTAMEIFGVSSEEVLPEMRRNAKVVNFGILYGMGPHGLSEALGKSRTECKQFIDRFFERFPGVRQYMDENIRFGREHGYVRTMFGRRKYYPELKSSNNMKRSAAERAAINMPLQGSAADIIKMAMVKLHRELVEAGLPKAILLQVHDELILSVPQNRAEEIIALAGCTMSGIVKLNVPLVVNCKIGPNWLEMVPAGDYKAGFQVT